MIAFIPATYALGHLYTSSLHNGSLYSASNVFYVAIFAFSTSYLRGAMQQVVNDSGHMDSTKAVYELLYFLTRCCAKLSSGPRPLLHCMREAPGDRCNETFANKAWRSPWVMLNCFLSIACQDDSRIWGQFLGWFRRRHTTSMLDYVPSPSNNGLTGYAYWLFSQDGNVYNYTGSVILREAIPEKLSIASYSTREMYPAAHRFLTEMSRHFQQALKAKDPNTDFTIRCSAGGRKVAAERLCECLCRVRFENQGLNMAVERYICRRTPDYAALSLPAAQVLQGVGFWAGVMYDGSEAADALAQALAGEHGSFYCTLWLAYNYMTLLGIDLLRMHNNKAVFGDHKQHQAGFFQILRDREPDEQQQQQQQQQQEQDQAGASEIMPDTPDTLQGVQLAAFDTAQRDTGSREHGHLIDAGAESESDASCSSRSSSSGQRGAGSLTIKAAADGTVTAARKPDELEYAELHDLSAEDLDSIAAIVATLLLLQMVQDAGSCSAVKRKVIIPWKPQLSRPANLPNNAGRSYLRNRAELVMQHSSLPAIVQGVECPPAQSWMRSQLLPLGFIVCLVTLVSIIFATISCSNGVFLVAIAGLVQAYAACALLLHFEQLPLVARDDPGWCSAGGFAPFAGTFEQLRQLLVMLVRPACSVIQAQVEKVIFFICLLKALGISLESCFNDTCRRLYKRRISPADLFAHASSMLAVLLFSAFIILALIKEPYYATGVGMCIGRCAGRTDCQSNITLGLHLFDTDASCPGEGRVVKTHHLPYHQCPAVLMVLKVSDIAMDTAAVTPSSSNASISKLAGSQAIAAAEALDQPAGTLGRRLHCSCESASPAPADAQQQQQQPQPQPQPPPPQQQQQQQQPQPPPQQQQQQQQPPPASPQTGGEVPSTTTRSGDAVTPPPADTNTSSASPSPAPDASPAAGTGKAKESGPGSTQLASPAVDTQPYIPTSTPAAAPTAAATSTPQSPGSSNSPSPSVGGVSLHDAGLGSSQQVPARGVQQGTTACTATVTLTGTDSGAPAKEGVTVTAVWYVMVNGSNTLSSNGLPLQNATVKTRATGVAVFTSPPINASAGYGCNITILQPADGSYELNEKEPALLSFHKTW
ncbi:hypothetical protein OEZ85_004929 [Tetradesmus obliquus]|uniref:Uncharacterized protein n=1 Tax=Tetradesmus obliquus TaxID=3088 RepID=A0ABY8UGP5_TETOB|nr:hypothetical protein OEZ85_004929 [Tetradesmus obliquus]